MPIAPKGPSSSTPKWAQPKQSSGPAEQINEFKDLVVGYAKQETVDPLKSLGRSMGFGIAGSVMLGTGLFLGLLALLRGLQSIELFNDPAKATGGTWGWVPYTVTLAVGLILMTIFLFKLIRAMGDGQRKRDARSSGR